MASSSSATTRVGRQDIRKIIAENFGDTDIRFSNWSTSTSLNNTNV